MSKQFCPCGSKKAAQYCCQMYLEGKKQPETAEKLMRSRYTAFCLGNIDYLIATLHRDRRQPETKSALAQSMKNTRWLGLTIIATKQGNKSDRSGVVEFEAIYQTSQPGQLHERSRFSKIDGKWFYVEGDILPGTMPKPNAPCWCGSQKKFKHCHQKITNNAVAML